MFIAGNRIGVLFPKFELLRFRKVPLSIISITGLSCLFFSHNIDNSDLRKVLTNIDEMEKELPQIIQQFSKNTRLLQQLKNPATRAHFERQFYKILLSCQNPQIIIESTLHYLNLNIGDNNFLEQLYTVNTSSPILQSISNNESKSNSKYYTKELFGKFSNLSFPAYSKLYNQWITTLFQNYDHFKLLEKIQLFWWLCLGVARIIEYSQNTQQNSAHILMNDYSELLSSICALSNEILDSKPTITKGIYSRSLGKLYHAYYYLNLMSMSQQIKLQKYSFRNKDDYQIYQPFWTQTIPKPKYNSRSEQMLEGVLRQLEFQIHKEALADIYYVDFYLCNQNIFFEYDGKDHFYSQSSLYLGT